MNENILLLKSPLKQQIWGGNYFKETMKITASDEKYGEYWTISGYPNNSSIVKNGKYQGLTLDDIYKKNHDLFASSFSHEFPILVKVIATSAKLSVQVHPDDEYAKKENDFGKTESWLIIDSKETSKLCYGHSAESKDELIKKLNINDFSFLDFYNVKRGNFIKVESGTVHAIGEDIVLIEVQQSSNVTYRLYDYDRIDMNGKKRELHLNKSMDVIKAPDKKSIDKTDYLSFDNDVLLWDNELFKIEIIKVENDFHIRKKENSYYLCTVVEGEFEYDNEKIKFGESFIVTSKCKSDVIKGKGKIIVTKSYR